ncbi:DNA-binding transcriptional MerR regulator [Paraburkholderia sp. GAS41]|uniref:glycosyltransferase domain-containing protein n=1 Tax=Paraburkholderia sp. GAS41 TaxID=3035134 RepID=UPI003D2561E7
MNNEKICIYTCIIGNYETLNELDASVTTKYPRICFTDNPALESSTWTVKLIEPAFPMDSIRSQRRVKILAHEYVPEFDVSLYVDNAVVLKAPIDAILNTYLQDADMAVPMHSFHSCVLDEFLAVAEHGLDEPSRVFEQLNHYQLTHAEVLDQPPYWTAILLRNHHRPKVRSAMVDWYNQVMRYSRRDQLSLNTAIARNNPSVSLIKISNHESWFHTWPIATDRKHQKRLKDFSMAGISAIAQHRLAQIKLEGVSSQLAERQRTTSELTIALDHTKEECRRAQQLLEEQSQRLEAQRLELEEERAQRSVMEATAVWRLATRIRQSMQRHPRLHRVATKMARGLARIAGGVRASHD